MYKEIFAIEPKNTNEDSIEHSKYFLKNNDNYGPKLASDHYLKQFNWRLLFGEDIISIVAFLDFQNNNCENSENFFSILDHKVIPLIDEIIENAVLGTTTAGYRDSIQLKDGFIETPEKIFKGQYEQSSLYYYCTINKLQADLKKRKEIIGNYLSLHNTQGATKNFDLLQWKGKPSHLALIITTLIDEGYIDPPKSGNQEINYTHLSRQILNSFSITDGTTENTLRIYLNPESEKHVTLKKNFDNQDFNIPYSGRVS
tara:strand:+ start:1543 stop:2313 length:771 start_codon:yes stop_codon:yes gene_type:complete